MNEKQLLILKNELNFEPSNIVIEKLAAHRELFLNYNSHTNLMSKGDSGFLFEKHIFDSLAILKYEGFLAAVAAGGAKKILDVGTGGGFPALILAICFENLEIIGVDSTHKKINFINSAIKELGLKNLKTICDRVENVAPLNVDIVTSRAVGEICDIFKNSLRHAKSGAEFIFYKANPEVYEKEIEKLDSSFKKPRIINYSLPTYEQHRRALLVFKV